ncbi:MAG: YkgJ family cysteine cluster protein [Candidatus Bathyarchaeia archaeon]|jgi:Fe-S-cluster containining protein
MKVTLPSAAGFKCKNCGVCCKVQPPEVDLNEQKEIESKGYRNFLTEPDEAGLRWIKRKKDGSCMFLESNKCKIYPVRPVICKLEPFTIADYNYPEKRIELALNFPFSCSCEGVSKDGDVNVEEVTMAALAMMKKILALTARDLELPESDKRVSAEARARILRQHIDAADLTF